MVRAHICVRYGVVKGSKTHLCVPETGMGENKNTETKKVCNSIFVCRRQGWVRTRTQCAIIHLCAGDRVGKSAAVRDGNTGQLLSKEQQLGWTAPFSKTQILNYQNTQASVGFPLIDMT